MNFSSMESSFHYITGTVQRGEQRGRLLWFPTLNVPYTDTRLADGVYKINVRHQERIYGGVGTYFHSKQLFEAHLFLSTQELYGETVDIIPLQKLRNNQQFSSLSGLTQQIQRDCENAFLDQRTVLTFGTFDYFHPGHAYYLSSARLYGDRLVTVIARDVTVASVKGNAPDHTEQQRKQSVMQSGLTDLVVLGDEHNYYTCIQTFKPHVICLGYDQRSFDVGIQQFCMENNLSPHIVRLPAFEPDRRKSSLIKQHR